MDIFSWLTELPAVVGGYLAVVGNFVLGITAIVYDHVTGGGLLTVVYVGMCAVLVAGVVAAVTLDRRNEP